MGSGAVGEHECYLLIERSEVDMKRRRFLTGFVPLLAVLSRISAGESKPCPELEPNAVDARFKSGQVWSYHTRSGESASTLTILQVDRLAKAGIVVHVRVDGLRVHNPRGELVPFIEHMPFSRDAMLSSALELLRSGVALPTMEGYDRWRADCGGVYTISVADALDVMEKTFNAPE